jgi:hypothetical protein
MKKEKHILQTKKVQMSQIELRVIVRKRLMAMARTVPAVGQVIKNLPRCICLTGAKHFPQSGLG